MERKEYIPASDIISELTDYLNGKPRLDFITFGGSGEPTLNSEIGAMVQFLKRAYPEYKTALLTNGTLLYLPEVREAVLPFDCVLPSFDAASERVFKSVNRPHPDLRLDRVTEGLIAFSRRYSGALWLEVFIIPGINDGPDELAGFKEIFLKINPTRVQLNSLDRPGTCDNVATPTPERLREIAVFFSPLPVEIISRAGQGGPAGNNANAEALILSTLTRRPLTIEEIASLASLTINDCAAILRTLREKGSITSSVVNNREFYRVL
jgi:wyosine [tRNA(Phe)-imidazoG37] synthetase (radical SAM superfamily)